MAKLKVHGDWLKYVVVSNLIIAGTGTSTLSALLTEYFLKR